MSKIRGIEAWQRCFFAPYSFWIMVARALGADCVLKDTVRWGNAGYTQYPYAQVCAVEIAQKTFFFCALALLMLILTATLTFPSTLKLRLSLMIFLTLTAKMPSNQQR